MSKTHICKYCKKDFSTKSNLNYHQKNTAYCLQIQNKIPYIVCEFCNKNFSSERNLKIHISSCSKKEQQDIITVYEKQITDLKAELVEKQNTIQMLQDKLENVALQMARRPTHQTYNNRTQINTIIQNLQPVSDSYLKDQSENLTIEHLKRGVKGYVEYAMKFPLKNRVLCVDYARRKIKYKDDEGKTVTDPEMLQLSKRFFESIRDKNRSLAYDCVQQLSDDMDAVEKMKIMADMGQLMVDVNQSARGDKTDFTHDFVKGVCSESVR